MQVLLGFVALVCAVLELKDRMGKSIGHVGQGLVQKTSMALIAMVLEL